MKSSSPTKVTSSKEFIIGQKNFIAISKVEGLTLTRNSEIRLLETRHLSPKEGREITIQAFSKKKK